ncbi:hypothetical protein RhiirC2_771784 [Rhizophagus irregularis]|uniref:Uncharacterized protein n=1 Tax=Rhizophagus irregularis TaxID=588596 RepID=A0A2N1NT40_9GLOM|nr:hypothetical protein RhiirC2_771784 [Rhizophagus irregularis]
MYLDDDEISEIIKKKDDAYLEIRRLQGEMQCLMEINQAFGNENERLQKNDRYSSTNKTSDWMSSIGLEYDDETLDSIYIRLQSLQTQLKMPHYRNHIPMTDYLVDRRYYTRFTGQQCYSVAKNVL